MSFLRKLFRLSGCARLSKNHNDDKKAKEFTEAMSDDRSEFEDNDFRIHKEEVFAKSLSELEVSQFG